MESKTKNKKQEIPKWFNGEVYAEGATVKNPFSGETYELNALELSLYDFINGSLTFFAKFKATDKQIKDFDKALYWFRVNNPKAYMVLLD